MQKKTTKDWKKITRDSYDRNASQFAVFSGTFRGKKLEWIKRFTFLLNAKSTVLDVGCGAGDDASYFFKKGYKVTGIDFSSELIKICKKNLSEVDFRVMDFEDLRFEKNTFDGIWAMASLVHVPRQNLPAVLQKIYSVLKSGGLFFASFRVGEEGKMTIEQRGNAHLKRFYEYYPPSMLQEMLKEAGFKDIEQDLDHIISGDWVAFFCRK